MVWFRFGVAHDRKYPEIRWPAGLPLALVLPTPSPCTFFSSPLRAQSTLRDLPVQHQEPDGLVQTVAQPLVSCINKASYLPLAPHLQHGPAINASLSFLDSAGWMKIQRGGVFKAASAVRTVSPVSMSGLGTVTFVSRWSASSQLRTFAPAVLSAWNDLSFGCTSSRCQLPELPCYIFPNPPSSSVPLYITVCHSAFLDE